MAEPSKPTWEYVDGCKNIQKRDWSTFKVGGPCCRTNGAGITEEVPVGTILQNVTLYKGKAGKKQTPFCLDLEAAKAELLLLEAESAKTMQLDVAAAALALGLKATAAAAATGSTEIKELQAKMGELLVAASAAAAGGAKAGRLPPIHPNRSYLFKLERKLQLLQAQHSNYGPLVPAHAPGGAAPPAGLARAAQAASRWLLLLPAQTEEGSAHPAPSMAASPAAACHGAGSSSTAAAAGAHDTSNLQDTTACIMRSSSSRAGPDNGASADQAIGSASDGVQPAATAAGMVVATGDVADANSSIPAEGAQQQQQPAPLARRIIRIKRRSSSSSSHAGPDSGSCAGPPTSSSSRGGSSSTGTNCQALQPLEGDLTVVAGSNNYSSSAADGAHPSTGMLVDGSGSLPPTAPEVAAASPCSSFPKLPAEGLVLQGTGAISVFISSQVLACSSCCVVYRSTASQAGRGEINTVTKLYESSERGRAAQQHEAAVSAAIRAARSCNGSSLRDRYVWVVPGAPSTATIAGVEHPCTVLTFWGSPILELLQEFPKGVEPEVAKAFVRQLLQVLVLHERVDAGFTHTGLGALSVFAYQLGKDSPIRIGGFSGCRLASDPVAIRRGTRSSQRQVIEAQAAVSQRQGQVMGVARVLVDMLTGGGYTQRASSSSTTSSSDASSSNNSSSRGYSQLTSRRRSAPGSYQGAFTELVSRVCGSSSSSNTTTSRCGNAGSGSGTSSSSSHHAGSGRVSYRHDLLELYPRSGGRSDRLPKLWRTPAMRAAHGFVLCCLEQKDSEPEVTAAWLLKQNWLKPAAATDGSSKAGAKRGLEDSSSDVTMDAAEGNTEDDACSSMAAAAAAPAAAAGAVQEQQQELQHQQQLLAPSWARSPWQNSLWPAATPTAAGRPGRCHLARRAPPPLGAPRRGRVLAAPSMRTRRRSVLLRWCAGVLRGGGLGAIGFESRGSGRRLMRGVQGAG